MAACSFATHCFKELSARQKARNESDGKRRHPFGKWIGAWNSHWAERGGEPCRFIYEEHSYAIQKVRERTAWDLPI